MLVCVLSLGNLSKFHRECLDSAVEPFLTSLWDPFKTGKPSGSPDQWARTELSRAVHAASKTGRGLANCFVHFIHPGSEGQGAVTLTLPWKRYLAGLKLLDSKNYTSILATDYLPPSKPEYPEYFFAYQIWSAYCHLSNTMPCWMFRWARLSLDVLWQRASNLAYLWSENEKTHCCLS